MSIKSLTIEDVRCFAGKQEFNVSPITFVVGENSTGKSTMLGCLQILSDLTRGEHLDFNREPYKMGAFADIVRRSNPRKKAFKLGLKTENKGGEELAYSLTLMEADGGSEPVIQEQSLLFANGDQLVLKPEDTQDLSARDSGRGYFGIKSIEKQAFEKGREGLLITANKKLMEGGFHGFIFWLERIGEYFPDKKEWVEEFVEKNFQDPDILFSWFVLDIDSFAPMRSNPKRTYDSVKTGFSPEGSDMPMVLMNMSSGTEKSAWNALKKQLVAFGKASGLFTGIDIRNLGNKSDPFQVQIKVRGPKANLVDVGYGVSQILPILVRIFTTRERTTFLMQQPEVHLHPKGQAELSSLLVNLAKTNQQNFIIETHSDYMIDRARIEIMQGTINPDDVSLIYLEPDGNRVKVHNISFDEQGNLLKAPESYRDFFLKESDKLLGFS